MKSNLKTIISLLYFVASCGCAVEASGNEPTLTLVLAQKLLNQQINYGMGNTLNTCNSCCGKGDKEENTNAAVVTEYTWNSKAISEFLIARGYIRVGEDGRKLFSKKAKNSKYYYCQYRNSGFRFANMRHPRILTKGIVDVNNVPIEYDFVPTEVTKKFFGEAIRVKGIASFAYFDGDWFVNVR